MNQNKKSEEIVSDIAAGLHLNMATETIFRTLCGLSKIKPGSANFEAHMVYLRDYINFILDEDSSEHLKWSFLRFVDFSEAEYYYDLFSLIIKGIDPFCAKLITTFRDEVLSANNFYAFKEGLKGLRDLLNTTEYSSDSIKGFYRHTEDPNRIVYVYGMYFCDKEKRRFCLYLDPSTGDCSAPEETFLKRFSKVEVEESNYNNPINGTLHVKRKLDLNDSSNNTEIINRLYDELRGINDVEVVSRTRLYKLKDLHLTNHETHLALDAVFEVTSKDDKKKWRP